MKPRSLAVIAFLVIGAGIAGYLAWQNTFVPVALAPDAALYVAPMPEFGEDQAVLNVQMPAGPDLDTFLANQSDLTILTRDREGALVGQLAEGLQRTRHDRRWRVTFKEGVHLQDGTVLDASRAQRVLAGALQAEGAQARVLDSRTLELRFTHRVEDVPERLTRWRIPGSGPFARQGTTLMRFNGFMHGRAGLAGLRVDTDPAQAESRPWADGIVSGRWAWAVFPGRVAPEDMARVRLTAYDEVHLQGGQVWFVSQRLRRFHPDQGPWPENRLFGVWQGSMNLPRAGALQ